MWNKSLLLFFYFVIYLSLLKRCILKLTKAEICSFIYYCKMFCVLVFFLSFFSILSLVRLHFVVKRLLLDCKYPHITNNLPKPAKDLLRLEHKERTERTSKKKKKRIRIIDKVKWTEKKNIAFLQHLRIALI